MNRAVRSSMEPPLRVSISLKAFPGLPCET
jgi:hypothetical protein